jgi:hypothetical protein
MGSARGASSPSNFKLRHYQSFPTLSAFALAVPRRRRKMSESLRGTFTEPRDSGPTVGLNKGGGGRDSTGARKERWKRRRLLPRLELTRSYQRALKKLAAEIVGSALPFPIHAAITGEARSQQNIWPCEAALPPKPPVR